MPRRPIFDIWDHTNKQMHFNLSREHMADGLDLFNRVDCFLMQHLGCRDIHGRMLREGDVVRNVETGTCYALTWSQDDLGYVASNSQGYRALIWTDNTWERVGTIYETPELLG